MDINNTCRKFPVEAKAVSHVMRNTGHPSQWGGIPNRSAISNREHLMMSILCRVRIFLYKKPLFGYFTTHNIGNNANFWHQRLSLCEKKISDKMIPPVRIEPKPLITSDSKSNTIVSTLN